MSCARCRHALSLRGAVCPGLAGGLARCSVWGGRVCAADASCELLGQMPHLLTSATAAGCAYQPVPTFDRLVMTRNFALLPASAGQAAYRAGGADGAGGAGARCGAGEGRRGQGQQRGGGGAAGAGFADCEAGGWGSRVGWMASWGGAGSYGSVVGGRPAALVSWCWPCLAPPAPCMFLPPHPRRRATSSLPLPLPLPRRRCTASAPPLTR